MRVVVFTSYFIACFFLIALGVLVETPFLIAQNIILTPINVRGIYNAVKELRGEKSDSYIGDNRSIAHKAPLNLGQSDSKPPSCETCPVYPYDNCLECPKYKNKNPSEQEHE